MKNKKVCITGYIIVCILFVGYLIFSNQVISMGIPEEQMLREVNLDEYSTTATPFFSMENSISYVGGMYEYMTCSGWAFCETEYDNSNKSISIIFRNVKTQKAYACKYTDMWDWAEVYNSYKDIKRIYNGDVSVRCKFSALLMPQGTYEMLIYVEENEYDYGLVTTGRYFKKTAADFINVDKYGNEFEVNASGEILSKEEFFSVEQAAECGKWAIDSVKKDSDCLAVTGWASYSESTNLSQELYVAITYADESVRYFNTQLVCRNDLDIFFDTESYWKCGFKTIISTENIDEMYSISLISEINGKYYPIVWNAQNIQEQILKEEDMDKYSTTSVPFFSLDESFSDVGRSNGYIQGAGWAFCETDYENENKKVSFVFSNVETGQTYAYECAKLDNREDIYNLYKDSKRIRNGKVYVQWNLSTKYMPQGLYEFLIYVEENEFDYGIVSTGKFYRKTANDFVSVDCDGNEYLMSESGTILAREVQISVEDVKNQGKWSIDSISKEEDSITISGWASYSEETNLKQFLYIAITYVDGTVKYYTTNILSRNDLDIYFKSNSYWRCGFKSTIVAKDIDDMKSISLFARIGEKYYPIMWNGKDISK